MELTKRVVDLVNIDVLRGSCFTQKPQRKESRWFSLGGSFYSTVTRFAKFSNFHKLFVMCSCKLILASSLTLSVLLSLTPKQFNLIWNLRTRYYGKSHRNCYKICRSKYYSVFKRLLIGLSHNLYLYPLSRPGVTWF